MKRLFLIVFTIACFQMHATTHNVPNRCDKRVQLNTVFDYPTPKDYLLARLPSIIETLKVIESRNDISAIGDGGRAFGILQIHNVYVQEVNYRYKTNYSHRDMFEESCAEDVTKLYLTFFIERFENRYKKPPTEEDVVRSHNGGAYHGRYIAATKKYYRMYINNKTV